MAYVILPNDDVNGNLRDGKDYSKGSYVYANDAAIVTVINGNLDNDNIKTGAKIAPAKINGTAATLAGTETLTNKKIVSNQQEMDVSATTLVNKQSIAVTTAGIVVTLKTTECVNGNRITVFDASAGAGSDSISIVGEGGELLEGSATVYIVEDSGSITFEAYESNWYI